ncbi:MlaD family protein [uncultured Treponema sp.]|uniref:MlaD family protein n=1 Tax=uncultured Treponema sp. TaxID=162155 RepID=UPI0025E323AD|nr:MlaD family protein [uncultured Treponema sp.]
MKFKIRFADQIVGFFSLLAMALLIAFVFALGASQNWFVKKNIYYTYFPSGAGFSVGMDVTYKGFPIGKISDVDLEGSAARIEFYVLEDYAEYAKEFSLVELITSPIGLGSSFVFHPGRGTEIIPSGSEIFRIDSTTGRQFITAKKIALEVQEDSIGVMMKKVSSIMDNVNLLLVNLNSALSGREDTATPIKQIIANLNEITKNISALTGTLNNDSGAVPALLGNQLTTDISDVLKNISLVSDELTSISGSADVLVSNAVPEIDSALLQLNSILIEVQDVLTGVKNNAFIRGGVPDRTSGKASTSQLRSEDF